MQFPYLPNIRIAIRVLTGEELVESLNIGRQKVLDRFGDNVAAGSIDDYVGRELMFKAILTEDGERNFFQDPEQIGELSVDEFTHLLNQYNAVQEKYAPLETIKTEEDFNAMIEEIKKESPLGMSLSTHTLRLLVRYLAQYLPVSPRDNDTTFSDLSNSEENTKTEPPVKIKVKEMKLEPIT